MFSALIPVYNHAAFVIEAVNSALASPLVTEVLVVDDGSKDESAEVLRQLAKGDKRVRNLTEDPPVNVGAHVRLNQLVEAAKNDFVAVLNSDDRFVPGRFEICKQLIRMHGADFITGHLLIMDQTGKVIGTKRGVFEPEYPYPPEVDLAELMESGDVITLLASQNFQATTSNMVFTRQLHRTIGGFSDLRYCHDYDFAVRAALLGRCRYTSHCLTMYRVHTTNTIRESGAGAKVAAELRWIFERLLADYPFLKEREEFMRVMRHRPAEHGFDAVGA